MPDVLTIRLLKPSEISSQMLKSFQHKQVISSKYVKHGERYELMEADELREWSDEKRIRLSRYLIQQAEGGGFVAAAFRRSRLVGFASLDGMLQGTATRYVNLTMLFVDDQWKRQGIGKRLFQQMRLCAEHMGADKLFISAIPSYDTVSFYLHLGCSDAQQIIESFVDTPYDRYLEYALHCQKPLSAMSAPL